MKKLKSLIVFIALLVCLVTLCIGKAQAAAILYGVTGDGGSPSGTLFTLDQTDASSTFVMTLGAGDDGETIGFNPDDGLLYHSSGISFGNRAWESINVNTPTIVNSTQFTGPNVTDQNTAMTWNPATGTFLVAERLKEFFSATTAGVATDIGGVDEKLKGLAFVGSTLYGAAQGSDLLYDLNPLTGATNSSLSIILAGFAVEGATGLATNPDTGELWGLLKSDRGEAGGGGFRDLVIIDPLTGIATKIGTTDVKGLAGIAFVTEPIPEPSTIALLGIGLVGLAGAAVRWRLVSMSSSSPRPVGMEVMGYTTSGLLVSFLRKRYRQFRPIVDYGISIIALLIASPVLLVVAIMVKITSSGPVFYRQSRMGRNGCLFNIIKFRTMCANAESQTGPVWTKENDSRVTSLGRFLRRTHIDELPQLINVLKGDMSIIGPRPERPFFADIFKDEIHGYTRRLSVKPGITGLAQCSHRYDETIRDVRKKLRYDILYIERMCWMLDIRIIWRTLNISLLGEKV